jgi:hypothetical protein
MYKILKYQHIPSQIKKVNSKEQYSCKSFQEKWFTLVYKSE